jgi:methyl-accepting chemotaxis protein
MMTMTRLTDESGLVERVLVGIIAWALAAVVMLTSTLVAARKIDDRVAFIRSQTSPIDTDLDSVKLLVETEGTAANILTAAKPLSGQLDVVDGLTTTIDQSAKSINQTAGTINSSVDSINASAEEINGSARSINGLVKAINTSVRSIQGNAGQINDSVHTILGSFNGIRDTVFVIRGDHQLRQGFGGGLAGAARRVDSLLGLVQGIKGDTGNVLALVKTIDATARDIDGKIPAPS